MDEVTVLAPATVSNVVCGFDCLGFALTEPFEEVTVRRSSDRSITITNRDSFGLPTDPLMNVAGVALQALMDDAGLDHGFEIELNKRIKPGSGIGSSAASSCGAVVAANILLGEPYSVLKLTEFALEGERLASGQKHADNVAPCMLGGFTLVRSLHPLDIVELEFPEMYAAVLHPQIQIRTADARAVLPAAVPLKDAIRQWSNLGALVAGLAKGDFDLISRSLEDVIVEPLRRSMIPAFDDLKSAAIDAGSLGGGISGSGPSVFMLAKTKNEAHDIALAMNNIYSLTEIPFFTYVSPISSHGIRRK